MASFRYVLWVLPAVALAFTTVAITARHGGAVAWRRAIPLVASVQRDLDGLQGEREVLWGSHEEGDAFRQYRDAMNQARVLADRGGGAWRLQLSEALSGEEGSLEIAAGVVKDPAARLCIATLGRGAHAQGGALRLDWLRAGASFPPFLGAADAERLAFMEALVLLEAGDDMAAVCALLDGLQFGADLAEVPIAVVEMIGAGILGSGRVETFVAQRGWDQIEPAAQNVLIAGMRRLDDRLTFAGHSDAGDFVSISRAMEKELDQSASFSFAGGEVSRAACADFIQMRSRQLQSVRWAIDTSPSDGLRTARSNADANSAGVNPLLQHAVFSRDTLGQRIAHLTRFRATLAGLAALEATSRRVVRDPLDYAYDVLLTDSSVRVRGTGSEAEEIEITLLR